MDNNVHIMVFSIKCAGIFKDWIFMEMKYNLDYVRPKAQKEIEDASSVRRFKSGQLSYKVLHDAYVLPSDGSNQAGICTSDKQFISSSSFSGGEQRMVCFGEYKRIEATAIYVGCLYSVWGHAFLDNLRRLWFLLSEDGTQFLKNKDVKLIYVNHFQSAPGENFWKLVKRLGLPHERFEVVTEVTQFREIIFPETSFCYADNASFYEEHNSLIEKILEDVPDDNRFEKVYFSRACLRNQQWREYGEYKIERIFKELGFCIFCPEKLSLEDQLLLMKNCKEFVAAEGSVAHNSIFCQQGTKVTILRKADYVNDYQLAINEMRSLDILYVDIHHSVPPFPISISIGPFYLYITKELRRLTGVHCLSCPYWLLPSYWWYIIRRLPWMEKYISNRKIIRRMEYALWDKHMHSNDKIRTYSI